MPWLKPTMSHPALQDNVTLFDRAQAHFGQVSMADTAGLMSTASAAALSGCSKKGLTDIEDIAPVVRFLVTGGWWMTGQTIFANGGDTTR